MMTTRERETMKKTQNFLTIIREPQWSRRTFAVSIRNDKALAEKLLGGADFSPRRRSLKGKEREQLQ